MNYMIKLYIINDIHGGYMELITKRMILKPIALNDAKEIFVHFNADVTVYMYPKPADDISETIAFINSSIKKYKKNDIVNVKIIEIKDDKIRFSKRALDKDPLDWFNDVYKKVRPLTKRKFIVRPHPNHADVMHQRRKEFPNDVNLEIPQRHFEGDQKKHYRFHFQEVFY